MKLFSSCNNIIINNNGHKIFSVEYIHDRDLEWNKEYSLATKLGKPLWNGTVLCLKNIMISDNSVVLNIHTCEYKDIVMREKHGNQNIAVKYEKTDSFQYINVQCIITDQSGNLLFGTQEDIGKKKLISIGGTLRNDNSEISSLNDVFLYMLDEINTETYLNVIQENVLFEGIVIADDIMTFLYSYTVKNETFEPNQQYLKRGEFTDEYVINKKKMFFDDSVVYHERLKSISPFISVLKNLI